MQAIKDDPAYIEAMEELLMGDQAIAKDSFLRLEERYPDNEHITYTLGIIFYGLGDLEKSIEYCEKTVELREDSGNAHYRMGVCYFRIGKFADALREFKLSTRITGSRQAMVYYYMGEISMYVGQDDDAIEYLGQLRQASPQTKMALFLEAQLRIKKRAFEPAVELLQEFLEVSPDIAEAHHMLGVAYMGLHKNMKALRAFSRAVELDPDDKPSARAIDRLTDPY
jgi:tetratricopeptide (TPR) repeat protein